MFTIIEKTKTNQESRKQSRDTGNGMKLQVRYNDNCWRARGELAHNNLTKNS